MFDNILEDILVIGAFGLCNYMGQRKGYADAKEDFEKQRKEMEILELKKQILELQKKDLING